MKQHEKITMIFLFAILVMVFAISLPSCGRVKEEAKETEVKELETPPPQEECADFAGKWDTNRGELEVKQEGCEAEGTLKGIGGGYYKFEGHVTEATWDFAWKGPEGRGKGYFTMDPALNAFIGEHGDGENNTGKGKWDGKLMP